MCGKQKLKPNTTVINQILLYFKLYDVIINKLDFKGHPQKFRNMSMINTYSVDSKSLDQAIFKIFSIEELTNWAIMEEPGFF